MAPAFCTPLSTGMRSGERKSKVIGGEASAASSRGTVGMKPGEAKRTWGKLYGYSMVNIC